MAVESFIPMGDVKQTIEKEVRKKPSVAELTTVETPGRPSPADMLEDDKPKETFQEAKEQRSKKS